MFFFPQLTSQLISLAAIGVYLAAAFLPCEPTAEERSAIAIALGGGAVHAVVSHVEPAVPDHAAHDHAAHRAAGHGSETPSGKSTSRAHAADEMTIHPGLEARPLPLKTHTLALKTHTLALRTHLALKAKCVCGCDRTRSQVGGGAARLGSVVMAAAMTGLAPAPLVVPEDRVLTRWAEVYFEDDLVPI